MRYDIFTGSIILDGRIGQGDQFQVRQMVGGVIGGGGDDSP